MEGQQSVHFTFEEVVSFVEEVRQRFIHQPQVYIDFLAAFREYRSRSIDRHEVVQRISRLFRGHPELVVGFNRFLPPTRGIEIHPNEQVPVGHLGGACNTGPISSSLEGDLSTSRRTAGSSSNATPLPSLFGNDGSTAVPIMGGRRFLNDRVFAALNYLDEVEYAFRNQSEIFYTFLHIMKEMKAKKIDLPGLIRYVLHLFKGHPNLIIGFGRFLPPGYSIEILPDGQIRATIPGRHLLGGASNTEPTYIILSGGSSSTSSMDAMSNESNDTTSQYPSAEGNFKKGD